MSDSFVHSIKKMNKWIAGSKGTWCDGLVLAMANRECIQNDRIGSFPRCLSLFHMSYTKKYIRSEQWWTRTDNTSLLAKKSRKVERMSETETGTELEGVVIAQKGSSWSRSSSQAGVERWTLNDGPVRIWIIPPNFICWVNSALCTTLQEPLKALLFW